MQVEARTRHQQVQPDPEHTHRFALVDKVHGGKLDVAGIDQGDPAAAFDLDHVVGTDESRRILVQAHADGERVVRQRCEQAANAVALAEMLVDDDAIRQPQARRQPHAASDWRSTVLAEGDHVLADETGTGAGAGDMRPLGIAHPDQLCDRGTTEDGGQAQLVAAGEKDSGGRADECQLRRVLAFAARIEIGDRDRARAKTFENFLVTRTRVHQPAGGGQHDDACLRTAAEVDEALQDLRIVFLFLATADWNDPASGGTVWNLARAHQRPLPVIAQAPRPVIIAELICSPAGQ